MYFLPNPEMLHCMQQGDDMSTTQTTKCKKGLNNFTWLELHFKAKKMKTKTTNISPKYSFSLDFQPAPSVHVFVRITQYFIHAYRVAITFIEKKNRDKMKRHCEPKFFPASIMVSELFAAKPHDSKPKSFLKAGLRTENHQSQNSVSKSRTAYRIITLSAGHYSHLVLHPLSIKREDIFIN